MNLPESISKLSDRLSGQGQVLPNFETINIFSNAHYWNASCIVKTFAHAGVLRPSIS